MTRLPDLPKQLVFCSFVRTLVSLVLMSDSVRHQRYIGMALSSLISFFIVLTTSVTLNPMLRRRPNAISELRGWRIGLEQEPQSAKAFYGIIAPAFGLGLGMLFLPIDLIKALFWSAVLNGVIAVPLMVATMIVASS